MPTAVQFSSQYSELRLIRRTAEERITNSGAVAVVKPEVVLEFKEHFYYAVEGRNKLNDLWSDAKDDFLPQDELTWLRSHDGYGTLFHEIPEVAPEPGDLLKDIAMLAARGDRDALMEIGRQEVEGYNRPEVLDLLKEIVESLPVEAKAG